MIKKENKSIMITLDPEHLELLNSLASRFHCSKTDLIKQALKVFAGSKNHVLKTYYQTKSGDQKLSSEEWNKLFEDKPKDKPKNEDEMPF